MKYIFRITNYRDPVSQIVSNVTINELFCIATLSTFGSYHTKFGYSEDDKYDY